MITRAAILAALILLTAAAPLHAAVTATADDDTARTAASTPATDDIDDQPVRLIVTADFNRDGIPDTAEINPPTAGHPATLTLSLGKSSQPPTTIPIPDRSPQAIVTADFNHDGFPDIIIGDDDGTLRLFLGNPAGTLTPAGIIAHLESVVSIAVADFNHDGSPDLAVTDWHSSKLTVLLNNGNAAFRTDYTLPLRLPGTSPTLTTADFNRDGLPDLAVVYGDDDGYTYDVLLNNGAGFFTLSPTLTIPWDANAHCAPSLPAQ